MIITHPLSTHTHTHTYTHTHVPTAGAQRAIHTHTKRERVRRKKSGGAHLQNFLPSASLPVQCTVIFAPFVGVGPLPSCSTCGEGLRVCACV